MECSSLLSRTGGDSLLRVAGGAEIFFHAGVDVLSGLLMGVQGEAAAAPLSVAEQVSVSSSPGSREADIGALVSFVGLILRLAAAAGTGTAVGNSGKAFKSSYTKARLNQLAFTLSCTKNFS